MNKEDLRPRCKYCNKPFTRGHDMDYCCKSCRKFLKKRDGNDKLNTQCWICGRMFEKEYKENQVCEGCKKSVKKKIWMEKEFGSNYREIMKMKERLKNMQDIRIFFKVKKKDKK